MPEPEKSRIEEVYGDSSLSIEEVSRRLGVSISALYELLRSHNIENRNHLGDRPPPEKIITRAEAKEAGGTTYYTGKACPRGHRGWRYTSRGSCVECLRGPVRERKESKRAEELSMYRLAVERDEAEGIPLTSREEARRADLVFYFTGRPCRNASHYSRRYVSSKGCLACAQDGNLPILTDEEREANASSAGLRLVSRQEAEDEGKTRYCNGIPCIHGHVGERHVSGSGCVVCADEKTAAIRAVRERERRELAKKNARENNLSLVSREDAEKGGWKRFCDGFPCHVGHLTERYVSTGQCVDCLASWTRHRRASDSGYIEAAVSAAKSRANIKKIKFDLTTESVPPIPKTCPLLDIPLTRASKQRSDHSPSLDRIINDFGYTPDNIHWISHRANTCKQDASGLEILLVGLTLYSRLESPDAELLTLRERVFQAVLREASWDQGISREAVTPSFEVIDYSQEYRRLLAAKITTSDKAKERGEKCFAGSMCIHGHDHGGGSVRRVNSNGSCVDCIREANRQTRATPRGRIKVLLRGARKRAEDGGLPFTLTVDDLHPLPDKCPIFGFQFIVGTGTPTKRSLTIDRANPAEGYTLENAWLISFKANSIKSNASWEELLRIAMGVIRLEQERSPCPYRGKVLEFASSLDTLPI